MLSLLSLDSELSLDSLDSEDSDHNEKLDSDDSLLLLSELDWLDWLDSELLDSLEGYEEIDVKITVPAMHEEAVIDWLSNGESKTSPGMGKGVLRRCGLL